MTDIQQKTIKDILNSAMAEKGITPEKMASITDIPEYYIRSLYNGNYKDLPPEPYVRGYILKIAQAVETDGEVLWKIYKKTLDLKTSGETDKMPSNRFAIKNKKINKKKWIIAGIIVLALVFIGFKESRYFVTPSIDIVNPPIDGFITNSQIINLRGKIDPQDKLTINNEDISVDKDGYFDKEWSLNVGPNTLEFKVKRLLKKEVIIDRQIIYQPQ